MKSIILTLTLTFFCAPALAEFSRTAIASVHQHRGPQDQAERWLNIDRDGLVYFIERTGVPGEWQASSWRPIAQLREDTAARLQKRIDLIQKIKPSLESEVRSCSNPGQFDFKIRNSQDQVFTFATGANCRRYIVSDSPEALAVRDLLLSLLDLGQAED